MESSTDNNGGDQNGDDPPKSRKKDAPGQDVATFEEYDDDEEEDSKATGSYNAGRKRKRERSGHQYRWEQMYNRLVEFRQRNGHCNVPNRYMEDPQLGSWVSAQRRAFKTITTGGTGSTAMTMERAQKLQQIGFHWRGTNPHNVPWEMRYKELLDFIKRFGHPNIPMRWKENVQLSNWVSKQRHDYKLLQRGTSNRLTPQRLKLLNDVGFVWEIERCAESTQQRLSVLGQRSEEDGSTTQQQSLDVKPPARNRGDPSGKVLSSGGGDGTLSGLSGTPVAAGATARMDANMMEMIAAAAASTARGPSATGTAVPSTCTAVAFLAALAGQADRPQQNRDFRQNTRHDDATNQLQRLMAAANEGSSTSGTQGGAKQGTGAAGTGGNVFSNLAGNHAMQYGNASRQQQLYMPILSLAAGAPGMVPPGGTLGAAGLGSALSMNLQSLGAAPSPGAAGTANPVLDALVSALTFPSDKSAANPPAIHASALNRQRAAAATTASGAKNSWPSLAMTTALAGDAQGTSESNPSAAPSTQMAASRETTTTSGSTSSSTLSTAAGSSAPPQHLNLPAIANLLAGANTPTPHAAPAAAASQPSQWASQGQQQGSNAATQNLIAALATSIMNGQNATSTDKAEQKQQEPE